MTWPKVNPPSPIYNWGIFFPNMIRLTEKLEETFVSTKDLNGVTVQCTDCTWQRYWHLQGIYRYTVNVFSFLSLSIYLSVIISFTFSIAYFSLSLYTASFLSCYLYFSLFIFIFLSLYLNISILLSLYLFLRSLQYLLFISSFNLSFI